MHSRFHKRIHHFNIKIDIGFLIKLILTIVLYIFFLLLCHYLLTRFKITQEFEKDIASFADKNQETVFEINEILLYSSANAKENEQSQQNWSLDITQFTDISFSISNPKSRLIQSLEIKDIEFNTTPEVRHSYFCL